MARPLDEIYILFGGFFVIGLTQNRGIYSAQTTLISIVISNQNGKLFLLKPSYSNK